MLLEEPACSSAGDVLIVGVLVQLADTPSDNVLDLIREKARGVKRVIVPEMNQGQYVREIQRVLPDQRVEFYGRMNGKLFMPSEIKEVIGHA